MSEIIKRERNGWCTWIRYVIAKGGDVYWPSGEDKPIILEWNGALYDVRDITAAIANRWQSK